MKCIILAAGKGSRMGDLTKKTPKPLLKIIDEKTTIDLIFESLPKEIEEIILVINYLSEVFKKEIKEKYKNYDKKIVFVKKNKKNGTLGSVYAAKKYLEDEKSFLVLQGDDIHQKKEIKKFIKNDKKSWSAAIGKIKMSKEYFYVECNKKNYFKKNRRQNKKEIENGAWIFSGMYLLNKKIFKIKKINVYKNSEEFGIPQTLMSHSKNKKLKIFREKKFLTANSKKEFLEMKKEIKIIEEKKKTENSKKNLEKIYKTFLKKKTVKIDSRNIKKGDIFFTLRGENFDGNNFVKNVLNSGADLVILDNEKIYKKLKNKYPKKIILVEDALKSMQDLAKKYRSNLKIPFLGITGSNGKTTTKELLKKVLSQKFNVLATEKNLNNHIGVPLTILSIKSKHNFAIIEMGANHISEIKILAEISKPNFGIITNIGKAHLGEFKNLKNIIKTKKELYDEILKNNGKIFINSENKILHKIASQFSAPQKIFYSLGKILKSENFLKIEINKKEIKTKIIGEYNLENFLAAFSVGKFFKIPEKKIILALEKYKPKNNRSEKEKTKKNNEIIWDCYNANPDSMDLSIKSFTKNKDKIFILGDMKELGKYSEKEHQKIINKISKYSDLKILVGSDFYKLKNKKNGSAQNFFFFKNILELKSFLKKKKIKNKNILIKGSNSIKLFELKNKNLL